MGAISEKYSDFSIITSDNPRFENPLIILNDIEKGFKNKSSYKIIEDRKEAIIFAIKMSKKDDIVLIAGKGHENYQIISGEKKYFDDKEIVKKRTTLIYKCS